MEYVKTTMIDTLLSLVAPHRCSSCGEIGSVLCESCKHNIVSEMFSGCLLCAQPCGSRGVCGTCAKTTAVKQAWCVGERDGALKALLDEYKFDSKREASRVCASLLDTVIPVLPDDIAVISIPSAPNAVRARGFDHMGRIAEEFAKARSLKRIVLLERASSATLHLLPARERAKLSSSLFRLNGQPVPRRILLLDDIVTTGTTMRAAAQLLRGAGAEELYLASLARQLLN